MTVNQENSYLGVENHAGTLETGIIDEEFAWGSRCSFPKSPPQVRKMGVNTALRGEGDADRTTLLCKQSMSP